MKWPGENCGRSGRQPRLHELFSGADQQIDMGVLNPDRAAQGIRCAEMSAIDAHMTLHDLPANGPELQQLSRHDLVVHPADPVDSAPIRSRPR